MVKNRSEDSKIKATLILAPLALLSQWKEEIAERSTCDLSVLIYHSSTKVAERKKVSNYDVVITTLDTLRGDWWDDEDSEAPKKPRGLYKIDWYRVVIDEAQIIRNRNSKKSRAVCALKSVYRWCLTGTPIFNTLWDIYPYLRFLRIRPYNDHHRFRDHISMYEKKKPNLAAQRAQAVLGTCMLRRQKNTKLDGKPLIVLPPKHEEDVMLVMTPDEREIYDMLEKSAQQKFNVFLRKGTVLKVCCYLFTQSACLCAQPVSSFLSYPELRLYPGSALTSATSVWTSGKFIVSSHWPFDPAFLSSKLYLT
jgi:SNF2 family DNA or RNA helicase